VTDLQRSIETLKEVDHWFAERGLGILIVHEGTDYWV
jgi:hypothetical protein